MFSACPPVRACLLRRMHSPIGLSSTSTLFPKKTSTFYFSNNSCQKLNNFKDFWHVKSWENWHENITDLSTSVDRTQCSLLVFLQYFTAKYHLNFLALLRHVGLSVAAPTRLLTVVLQINMLLIGAPNVRTHPTRILLLLVAPTALSTFRTSCDLEFWFLTLTVKLDIPYVPKNAHLFIFLIILSKIYRF